MKKKCIIIIAVIISIIGIFALVFKDYLPEISSRLALYHNTGEINLTIDGEKVELDDQIITYNHDTTKIKNNKFKFTKGSYGDNVFSFESPNPIFKSLIIEFGHFNTNWWHKVHYVVDIDITSSYRQMTLDIKQTIYYGKQKKYEKEKTDILVDNELSEVSVYAGP